MKISTKVEYGIVALIDIAINSKNGEVVTIMSISERQGISRNYLEQIITPLRQAKLIRGTKGAQGGYTLTITPEKLKLSTILEALDSCFLNFNFENSMKCNDDAIKTIKDSLWSKMDVKIKEIAENITLKDLADDYEKGIASSVMFYI
ncbi:MAG: Rrf2 family transcriptional regulator [Clostridiaceae bacterium]|nr:Rrf2 family transcriptional regulator [Clostridiaceae bacterium]